MTDAPTLYALVWVEEVHSGRGGSYDQILVTDVDPTSRVINDTEAITVIGAEPHHDPAVWESSHNAALADTGYRPGPWRPLPGIYNIVYTTLDRV